MFDYVFFDFDGTLFNTSPGIYRSFDYLIDHYGLHDFDKSKYDLMIGPPLKESFEHIMHFPKEEVYNAVKVYREYYSTKGMYECDVYDGIVDLLKNLRKAGKKIFVATSKPEVFAVKILEKKGMLDLFDFVGGSDNAETGRVEKVDVVNYVISSQKLEDCKNRCILIGDRKYDIQGAHAAGIKCAGILWGFGSREEFEEYGADCILETPEDVYQELIKC